MSILTSFPYLNSIGTLLYMNKGSAYLSLWLILNTSCNFVNRILFINIGWHFPILLTMLHGISCAFMHILVTKKFRWGKDEPITMQFFIRYLVPNGIFGCASIILNNLGLDIIDVATTQILKSMTPLFTSLLSYLIFGKKESWTIIALFIVTVFGVFLSLKDDIVIEKTSSVLIGYILVTTSAVARGIANILSEYLMTSSESKQKLHPLTLVFYSIPVEMAILIPSFLFVEFPQWAERYLVQISPILLIILIICNCGLVFALRIVTNLAILDTSALTITVAAQVKFIISILVSLIYFNYQMTLLRFLGLALVVYGTFTYGTSKTQKHKNDEKVLDV